MENPDVIDPGKLAAARGPTPTMPEPWATSPWPTTAPGDPAGLFGGVGHDRRPLLRRDQFGGTPPEVRQLDLRDVLKENSFFRDTYLAMHRARESAERAGDALEDVNDQRQAGGETYAVSGLMTTVIGETYCSGTPFSSTLCGTMEYGVPLSTTRPWTRR